MYHHFNCHCEQLEPAHCTARAMIVERVIGNLPRNEEARSLLERASFNECFREMKNCTSL